MKIETLKRLVIEASEKAETKRDLLEEVIKLLSLYEKDGEGHQVFAPYVQPSESAKVPYHEICSCNSKNGGSGICGCTIGNKPVDRNAIQLGNWTSTSSFPALDDIFGKSNLKQVEE